MARLCSPSEKGSLLKSKDNKPLFHLPVDMSQKQIYDIKHYHNYYYIEIKTNKSNLIKTKEEIGR